MAASAASLGLFLALCILQVIASGFNLMGLSPHLALASWGLILLLVMATKRLVQTVRPHRRERS